MVSYEVCEGVRAVRFYCEETWVCEKDVGDYELRSQAEVYMGGGRK